MSTSILRGQRLTIAQQMVTETCCRCGMAFAMTVEFQHRALNRPGPEGMTFYCPAGHPQHYTGETTETRLLRENQRLKQNQAYLEDAKREAREEAEHERHRANGYKGWATKLGRRARAGVCHCCCRSFQNVARHMASQHPDFAPAPPEA